MQNLNDYCESRYYFEHRVLRNWFYGDDTGEELIRGLLKEAVLSHGMRCRVWAQQMG